MGSREWRQGFELRVNDRGTAGGLGLGLTRILAQISFESMDFLLINRVDVNYIQDEFFYGKGYNQMRSIESLFLRNNLLTLAP